MPDANSDRLSWFSFQTTAHPSFTSALYTLESKRWLNIWHHCCWHRETKEAHLHEKGGFSAAVQGGRVIGSFLCLPATDSAIGLPCLTLRGSQSAETAPSPLLTTKRPLSPNNSCAVCDFCVALGVRFMFNGSLREEQTSLPLLCAG